MVSQKILQNVLVILANAKNLVFKTGGSILRRVYPEPKHEILRSAQDDRLGAQDGSFWTFYDSITGKSVQISLLFFLSFNGLTAFGRAGRPFFNHLKQ